MRRFTERKQAIHRKAPSKDRQPQLVAITGGSGAGKSWLAERLQLFLGKDASARLSLDEFYRDRSHLPPTRRSALNFDHPRAIDWKWLERVLADFSAGRPALLPCYDFVEHVRICAVRWLQPRPVLIVDGLWLLRRPSIRRFFQHRIFIDCPSETRLERRLHRDIAERGRDSESVLKQFKKTVEPMHERFVSGQRRWATLVVSHPLTEPDANELGASLCRALDFQNPLTAYEQPRSQLVH